MAHRGGDRRGGRPDRSGPRRAAQQAPVGHGARRPGRARRLGPGHQRHRAAAVPALAEGHHATSSASHDLVTMYDDPVRIIEMPESRRGRRGGLLRPARAARAHRPRGQGRRRTNAFRGLAGAGGLGRGAGRSFYREYNRHMLLNLAVHEAMPGHVLQLEHSRRYRGNTDVRGALAERHVHRGLGGAQRAAGRRRGRGRAATRGRRRGPADAAAQDAAALHHQRDPRRPGALPRHDARRGDAADDGARPPGGQRGGRQVATGAAHLGPAVDLLRRAPGGLGDRAATWRPSSPTTRSGRSTTRSWPTARPRRGCSACCWSSSPAERGSVRGQQGRPAG